MFKNIFIIDGRIRRTEFGVTYIILFLLTIFISVSTQESPIFGLFYIPLYWVQITQSAKRCHDLNNSGWFQLIPIYNPFWLIFAEGTIGPNRFGNDPKEYRRTYRKNISEDQSYISQKNYRKKNVVPNKKNYDGGYDGGHNKSSIDQTKNKDKRYGGNLYN